MTSVVIENPHLFRYIFGLKSNLSKHIMNAKIMGTLIFNKMIYDLKGHTRSDMALLYTKILLS